MLDEDELLLDDPDEESLLDELEDDDPPSLDPEPDELDEPLEDGEVDVVVDRESLR